MAGNEELVDAAGAARDDTQGDGDADAEEPSGDASAPAGAEKDAEEGSVDAEDDDTSSARDKLRELGAYIREQRSRAEYSLRHLARLAGVSNPYLSQIERGLRKPSAEILQGIAKALQISSETLYVKAGILEERPDQPDLEAAILHDDGLNDRQRAALLEIYRAFRRENEEATEDTAAGAATVAAIATDQTVAADDGEDEDTERDSAASAGQEPQAGAD